MKKTIHVLAVTSLALLVSCGSGSDSSSGSGSSATSNYPYGLAISSPTATSTAGVYFEVNAGDFDSTKSFQEKKELLDSVAESTSSESCKVKLPNFAANPQTLTCYGPELDYQNHLNYTSGTPAATGRLPGGDLGIWTATESGGTACSAAKMNAEINNISSQVDTAMLLAGSMTCLINSDSTLDFPAAGASVDLTSALNTAILTNNSGVTVTAASLARQSDIASFPDFVYTIVMTKGTTTLKVSFRHHPTNEGNTTYKGKISALFAGGMNGSNSRAFSILYEKDSSALKYKMLAANFSGSSTTESNYFTATGDLKIQSSWSGNISQTLMNLNPENGIGFASYAWQAGTGDSEARVFNMYTAKSGANTSGYGFFGYGPKFDNTLEVAPNNSITKFICNWAGPGSSHTGISGKAQKQIMVRNASGQFVPDSSVVNPNLILYAPVNSCDMLADADGSGGKFGYKLLTDSYPSPQPAVTNQLIVLGTDSDYSKFVAPTAPADF